MWWPHWPVILISSSLHVCNVYSTGQSRLIHGCGTGIVIVQFLHPCDVLMHSAAGTKAANHGSIFVTSGHVKSFMLRTPISG